MLSLKYIITSPNDRATTGAGGFSDLVILGQICRVNMYIERYNLRCESYLSFYVVYICAKFKIFIPPRAFLVFDSIFW